MNYKEIIPIIFVCVWYIDILIENYRLRKEIDKLEQHILFEKSRRFKPEVEQLEER